MIFIGGVQPRTVRIEKQPQACPSCAHSEVYLKRQDHYISLFFIPLIRIKKGVPFLVCENCGTYPDWQASTFESSKVNRSQKCGFCGRSVDPDFSYCPFCGKAL